MLMFMSGVWVTPTTFVKCVLDGFLWLYLTFSSERLGDGMGRAGQLAAGFVLYNKLSKSSNTVGFN